MELTARIKKCLQRHPEWENRRVAKSTGATFGEIEAVRRGTSPAPPRAEPAFAPPPPAASLSIHPPKVKAIPLSCVHLLSKKPVDLMKGRLYGLERGMGYPAADLARAWGVSEETLKYHAKNHKALAYVEATPGEYVPIVVHPETPKGDSL